MNLDSSVAYMLLVVYFRYGLQYLRSMEHLPDEVMKQFMQGQHVMRHKPGIWNAIWSDMYIESTFMRYGHGPGGIIGITLKPSTLTRWALSLHIVSRLVQDVTEMSNETQENVLSHKEEAPHRVSADNVDRQKLMSKMENVIDPLDPSQHPPSIVNIVTGRIAPDSVNVDNAIAIGTKQLKEFESALPEGFHNTISKKVTTMATMKKHVKVGNMPVYDTSLIYTRVIGLQASRDISMKEVLKYELSPVPPSLFQDNGDMRITKSKSVLKQKLQVEHSSRLSDPHSVIIDGCAALWVIKWPAKGTVTDFARNFMDYLISLANNSDVYLVFDRYHKPSTKDQTRTARQGTDHASRCHTLSLHTPLPSQKVVLTVSENKVQLIALLCQHIISHCHMLPTSHRLVVTSQDPTPFEVNQGVILQRHDMRNRHEEADVIIVNQVVHLANDGMSSLKVISDDTDVFILLIHHYAEQKLSCDLVMSSTISGRTVIDIKATTDRHKDIADQLLSAHALSGCDTVSQLYGIGKGTVLKAVRSGKRLDKLGSLDAPSEEITKEAASFIISCYGCKGSDMTLARHTIWANKMANKHLTSAPALKSLPPTADAFDLHVLRAHHQTAVWRSALDSDPIDLSPTDYGWTLDQVSQCFEPIPLPPDVSHAPLDVLQLIRCGCSSNKPCSTARCGCYSARLPCSMFCACEGNTSQCYNIQRVECADDADEDIDIVDSAH